MEDKFLEWHGGKLTDDQIKRLIDESDDYCDSLHWHFGDCGLMDWIDIADEARRVWNIALPECGYEEYSPMDGIVTAAVAESQESVYKVIARIIGTSQYHAIGAALEPWMDGDRNDSIGVDGLIKVIGEEIKYFEKEYGAHKTTHQKAKTT